MLKLFITTSLLFKIGLTNPLTLEKGKNLVKYNKNPEKKSFEKISKFEEFLGKDILMHKDDEFQNVCSPSHPFLCTFTPFTNKNEKKWISASFSGCIEKHNETFGEYFLSTDKGKKEMFIATCCYTLATSRMTGGFRRFLTTHEQKIWSQKSCMFKRWIKLRQYINKNEKMKAFRNKYSPDEFGDLWANVFWFNLFIVIPAAITYFFFAVLYSSTNQWPFVSILAVFSFLWSFICVTLGFAWKAPCVPGRVANFTFWLLYTVCLPTSYHLRASIIAIVFMTIIMILVPCCTFYKIISFENDHLFKYLN